MSETGDPNESTVRRGRDDAEQTARLSWFHWLIVFLSLCLTVSVWHVSGETVDERAARRFDRQVNRTVELLRERLQGYANFLQTTAGFIAASENVTPREWNRFVTEVEVRRRFPGITGLAVLDEVPGEALSSFVEHQRRYRSDVEPIAPIADRDVYYPTVLVWPDSLARVATGVDIGREERRREAARRALASGRTQITGPVLLGDDAKPGFLMLAAFERDPLTSHPQPAAGRMMTGAVVGRVLFSDLVAGALHREHRQVLFRLSDEGETFYDEHDPADADHDPEPRFERSRELELFGRRWQVDVTSTLDFRAAVTSAQPTLLLGAGLLVDILLFSLFSMHARARRRALDAAERLRAANADLEAFACTVSHDLKAPLQNIGQLAEFVAEDLAESRAGHRGGERGGAGPLEPGIERDVERIRREVRRARRLIDGVLEYTGLGVRPEQPAPVDTRALLEGIRESLDRETDHVVLVGDFPTILTYETRLEQVFANLVGNALKYHHDVDNARVTVTVEPVGERLRFAVADDGPGIDVRFHQSIFEPFLSLDAGADSTGVGLAIVRKTVELMGGEICVDSLPGRGTTFTFDWPVHVAEEGCAHVGGDDAADDAAAGEAWPKAA